MNKRVLWLSWYSLFILCALAGIIPQPQGVWAVLFTILAIGFFVPGGLLLKWAQDRDRVETIRQVRLIAIVSLAATTVMICLNYVSALLPAVWGTIFHYVLAVVSTPMFCGQRWIIGLFGWACLLSAAHSMLKNRK